MPRGKAKHRHSPGARFLWPDGRPAAVITYLMSDPEETAQTIADDLGTTENKIKVALDSLHSRGFIRKVLHSPGHYMVTKRGIMAVHRMMETHKVDRRASL